MKKRGALYLRVSTDDQRNNGFSIESQLRMLREYCDNNDIDIIEVYNDAGYSGKDLMRPGMQKLLTDIKSHKIDTLVAIKVDRLTRNNYDGFWLLNYCEEHNVKIILTQEPFDVSTANGEMIFGMNLVFGQRERKEIGARTKRAMEEMALECIHPSKPPYGYIRNKETGHLEINPNEALVVKEIFNLYKYNHSLREISSIMEEKEAYLINGKWTDSRVYHILTNSIYIGKFAFGKYTRKEEDILYIDNYCEPIIDNTTWDITRKILDKNKHGNYGEHIHLFSGIVKCPECGNILSSTITYKHSGKPNQKEYYHLTCKNPNCKNHGLHYNSNKIEQKLSRILDELVRYMYDRDSEIIVPNTNINNEIKNIDKAIEKLKIQSNKLVDLYISSNLSVETINNKNEKIKKEIDKLTKDKAKLDPNDEFKEYTIELLKHLDIEPTDDNIYYFKKELCFSFKWNSLNRKTKKELIARTISSLEITRDDKYNIEIKNIKFTEEFISKNKQDYVEYLYEILKNNEIGIKYEGLMTKEDVNKIEDKYHIIYLSKFNHNGYKKFDYEFYKTALSIQFFSGGIIGCPYTSDGINIDDNILLVPKIMEVKGDD